MDPLRFAPRMTGHEKEEPPHKNEGVLFFVLGVRHYGALEEDFVARMSPCRVFCKAPTTKHGLAKLAR